MSESELTHAIIVALNATGRVHVWRSNAGVAGGVRMAPKGCPDVVGYSRRSGRFVGIEVKLTGGRFSKEQLEWQK